MNLKKIVIIGPESTGKSTLSGALARELQTAWVPEHARTYLELLQRPYTEQDLLEIAKGQIASEDMLVHEARKFLICDTDLYVLKVWSENRYNRCHEWILRQIAERAYDFYLLTDIDFPWQDDPLREHPEEEMRRYFFSQYHDIVLSSGIPFTIVSGTTEARLQKALSTIRRLW